MTFIVLVCGGRGFYDREAVYRVLDRLRKEHPEITVLQGGAAGADQLAREWTRGKRGVGSVTEKAKWRTFGKAAGPLRNQKMIEHYKPQLVVAFPGGRGTADMVLRAKCMGIPVEEITP